MIQVITRVRYPELYRKMQQSARDTAKGPVMFTMTLDDGSPRLADSYNLLGATPMANILLFCHDDIVFMSDGWDEKIGEAIALGFDVVGAVGSKVYTGGLIFDSGKAHSAGRMVGNVDGERRVKLMAHRSEIEPVKVVDGMFMAVSRNHFLRTGFDPQFDGLWFYDLDLCLRSNCAVVDILVAHEKPAHLRGVYPVDMRPMSDYEPAFYRKHGIKAAPAIGDQSCDSMKIEDYLREVAA